MRIALVTYTIEGTLNASTNYAPFNADWNTERVPNGLYTLRTTVYDAGHNVLSDTTRTVNVRNANAPASSGRLTEAQAADLRARLAALLAPRASRKAAHFALAERAVKRGDTDAALLHVESVVAIDPQFNNARATLYRYNRETAGPCEGVWRCETAEKLVALTFDDGPNPAPNRTPALLDALRSVDAPGTFFVVGVRAEENPALLRRMAAEGHEIGNHSFSHPNLTYLTPVAVDRELCRTSVVVREATGRRPRFYRPPGGNFNRAVQDAAKALGMAGAYWTLDGLPYESPPIPPARLTRYVLENVRPGAIVLLHNAPDNTVAAIPDIVRGLRAKGYTVVTMSELVRRARPVVKGASGVAEKKRTAHSPFYGG
jgi:peptidoglycan/xylan/chitin deacetylase (PgdA/CDA1 family)